MGSVKKNTVNQRKQLRFSLFHRDPPRHATVFNPLPTIKGPDRAEVIHRIRLFVGLMEPVVNAGTKLHAGIRVLVGTGSGVRTRCSRGSLTQ